jgi:hypothetical protein
MKTKCRLIFLVAGCIFLFLKTNYSQQSVISDAKEKKNKRGNTGLFDNASILEISLQGNVRDLLNDRAEQPQSHPITIAYKEDDSSPHNLTANAKTRGHFRKMKENCIYPPILLHFIKSDELNKSVFRKQDKYKLVMPCRGDEYVVREWLVYKIYNLVTPKSFQAKLVKVKIEDTKSKRDQLPFYGILLEDDKKMAKRNNNISIERKLRPEQADTDAFLKMAVFEYLIGNTDWSVQYLQNIKLVAPDSNGTATTVPYDFDHSGLVNAPYARPAEELQMRSVLERRYRGYCVKNMKQFDASIALFNRIKKDIYRLYTDCAWLDEKYKKSTLTYLDEFYVTINNPNAMQKEFGYPCDPNGTGNIVIKGLREN